MGQNQPCVLAGKWLYSSHILSIIFILHGPIILAILLPGDPNNDWFWLCCKSMLWVSCHLSKTVKWTCLCLAKNDWILVLVRFFPDMVPLQFHWDWLTDSARLQRDLLVHANWKFTSLRQSPYDSATYTTQEPCKCKWLCSTHTHTQVTVDISVIRSLTLIIFKNIRFLSFASSKHNFANFCYISVTSPLTRDFCQVKRDWSATFSLSRRVVSRDRLYTPLPQNDSVTQSCKFVPGVIGIGNIDG